MPLGRQADLSPVPVQTPYVKTLVDHSRLRFCTRSSTSDHGGAMTRTTLQSYIRSIIKAVNVERISGACMAGQPILRI